MDYMIRFSENDLQVLSAALVELPYRMAAPLIDKINKQIETQQEQPKKSEDDPMEH